MGRETLDPKRSSHLAAASERALLPAHSGLLSGYRISCHGRWGREGAPVGKGAVGGSRLGQLFVVFPARLKHVGPLGR